MFYRAKTFTRLAGLKKAQSEKRYENKSLNMCKNLKTL